MGVQEEKCRGAGRNCLGVFGYTKMKKRA